MEKFDFIRCQERHKELREDKAEMFKRLKAVENRWLVLMAAHVATLGGIIAILITK